MSKKPAKEVDDREADPSAAQERLDQGSLPSRARPRAGADDRADDPEAAVKRFTREMLERPLQALARELDQGLREAHGQRIGFILLTFEFGDGGHLAYVSNGDRAGSIKAMREWLDRAEAGLDTDPPGPRAAS